MCSRYNLEIIGTIILPELVEMSLKSVKERSNEEVSRIIESVKDREKFFNSILFCLDDYKLKVYDHDNKLFYGKDGDFVTLVALELIKVCIRNSESSYEESLNDIEEGFKLDDLNVKILIDGYYTYTGTSDLVIDYLEIHNKIKEFKEKYPLSEVSTSMYAD